MIDTAIWLLVILVGIMALGVAESARSGRLAGVRWEEVKTMALGAVMVLITLTAAVLALTWAVVVFLAEVWQPFLIASGALVGGAAMIALFARRRSMFYASALAVTAIVLLLVL